VPGIVIGIDKKRKTPLVPIIFTLKFYYYAQIPEMTQYTSMCVKHGTTVRFLKLTNNPQTCYYENNTILKGVFIHMAVYSLFLIILYGLINQRSPLNDALKAWKRLKLY